MKNSLCFVNHLSFLMIILIIIEEKTKNFLSIISEFNRFTSKEAISLIFLTDIYRFEQIN